MNLTIVLVVAMLWLICALLIYGLTFAYFHGKFSSISTSNYRENVGFAIFMAMFMGLLGPLGLLVAYLNSGLGMHGLKFR